MSVRHVVLFSILCAVGAPVSGTPFPDVVPFVLHARGAVVVPVEIDGTGPFPFLLDTGATHSAVVQGLAKTLGVRAVAKSVVLTVAGEETRPVVRLDRVTLGTVSAHGLLVSVIAAPGVDLIGADIVGILGQDFLARHSYTIDYGHRQLSFHHEGSQEASAGTVGLMLRPSEGRFLVELPQGRKGNRVVRLVPDSGTETLVVFERDGHSAVRIDSRRKGAELNGLSGRRSVDVATVRSLRVGNVTLPDQVAAIVGRAAESAMPADGLLPLHLFQSVSFDNRGRQLLVRPW